MDSKGVERNYQIKGGMKMPKNIYKEQNEELKAEAERLRMEVARLVNKIEICLTVLGQVKKEE